MRKYLLLFITIQLISQNLVHNPSFEKTISCADSISSFNSNVLHLYTPTLGTADIFNSCSDGIVGIPENYNGNQPVKFGNKYAGCYFYAEDDY